MRSKLQAAINGHEVCQCVRSSSSPAWTDNDRLFCALANLDRYDAWKLPPGATQVANGIRGIPDLESLDAAYRLGGIRMLASFLGVQDG